MSELDYYNNSDSNKEKDSNTEIDNSNEIESTNELDNSNEIESTNDLDLGFSEHGPGSSNSSSDSSGNQSNSTNSNPDSLNNGSEVQENERRINIGKKAQHFCLIMLSICVLSSVLYSFSTVILESKSLEYRSYVDVFFSIVELFGIATFLILYFIMALLRIANKNKFPKSEASKTTALQLNESPESTKKANSASSFKSAIARFVAIILGIILFLYYLFVGFIFLLGFESTYQSEKKYSNGIIEGSLLPFLGGTDDITYHYYEDKGPIFKKSIRFSEVKIPDEVIMLGKDAISNYSYDSYFSASNNSDTATSASFDDNSSVTSASNSALSLEANNADSNSASASEGLSSSEDQSNPEGEANSEGSAASEDLSTPEAACRILYNQLFAAKGYAYHENYNAKGNFYVTLEEYNTTLNNKSVLCRHMLTYNGLSSNNNCQTFLESLEYIDPDTGTEYSASIEDLYAVEMETENVISSGKKAWSDTASSAYQKATGDK